MRIGILLAAVFAVGGWTTLMSGSALAHGGSDFTVVGCEHKDGDKNEGAPVCKASNADHGGMVLKCHHDDDEEE